MESAKAFDEANEVKSKAREAGYIHALSLYAVITDKETGHSEYRRIEVMSNVFWTGEIIELIYRFFQGFIPDRTYTIWLYNQQKEGLLNIGRYA